MTTEAERKDFLKKLKDFLEESGAEPMPDWGTIPEDSVIGVVRAEDFDPESNYLWEIEENKSYPRDLACFTCDHQVVMSDAMFKIYTTRGGRPKNVKCTKCLMKELPKNG